MQTKDDLGRVYDQGWGIGCSSESTPSVSQTLARKDSSLEDFSSKGSSPKDSSLPGPGLVSVASKFSAD